MSPTRSPFSRTRTSLSPRPRRIGRVGAEPLPRTVRRAGRRSSRRSWFRRCWKSTGTSTRPTGTGHRRFGRPVPPSTTISLRVIAERNQVEGRLGRGVGEVDGAGDRGIPDGPDEHVIGPVGDIGEGEFSPWRRWSQDRSSSRRRTVPRQSARCRAGPIRLSAARRGSRQGRPQGEHGGKGHPGAQRTSRPWGQCS